MRSTEGSVRHLASGRWQGRYTVDGERRASGTTATRKEATAALRKVLREIDTGTYHDTTRGNILFREFAPEALAVMDIAPRTRESYASLLTNWLLPTFGAMTLNQITKLTVDKWWITVPTGKVNRRNGYYVMRGIMKRAVRDGLLRESPCAVDNAGRDVAEPRPSLSAEQFRAIRDATTIPLVLDVMFGAHLRVAELVGLTRGDLDLAEGTLTVQRQSQQIAGLGVVTRETKTGRARTVYLLSDALEGLRAHVRANPALPAAPLFQGLRLPLSAAGIRREWEHAREATGLEWAHLHDVRHCSLTMAAPGASVREIMARAGHSTPAAAMRYQHATAERDREIARRTSERMAANA